MDFENKYFSVVERIFNNWQNLRLAVEHGMGGRNGQKVAFEFMKYVYDYCVKNNDITQGELQDVMEDILDQEFNTICDDSSVPEICRNLLRYKQLLLAGSFDIVSTEIEKLPKHETWIGDNSSKKIIVTQDSDSSSSDGDSDDEMEVDDACDESQKNGEANNTQTDTMDNEEEDPEWTTVRNRRKR